MEQLDHSPAKKALQINLDDSIYGTFAEIGAGQEVARHFFQAGRASHTIAKSISAYDMTFSDEIYGKESRYVCESRLLKMLDHEFSLLQERLRDKRGPNTRFFALANTVATGSQADLNIKSHGWMGIRFQLRPDGPANDIIMHIRFWDRFRLQQQEALGTLGVNLIHMAFYPPERPEARISALIESLSTKRIEVNMIRFSGPDLQHLDNRLLNLALVKQKLTDAVLFGTDGDVLHVGDALFRQPVLAQRGTFRPITNWNLEVLQKVTNQFERHPLVHGLKPKVLCELTMNGLALEDGHIDDEDFLHRVDTLSALGQEVLVTDFELFYQLKFFLRQYTDQAIGIVIGAALLPKLFDDRFYSSLSGGILEGMSRLFDEHTRVFVYPHKEAQVCQTSQSFFPAQKLLHLYKYLTENGLITDILKCEDVDTSIPCSNVHDLLVKGDAKWKTLVPPIVRELIESRQLFGYRP